jgi:hypothetical protein
MVTHSSRKSGEVLAIKEGTPVSTLLTVQQKM